MFTRRKATALLVVTCALPMFAAGAGQNGSKKVAAPSVNSRKSSLDYSIQTGTKRLYQLKWHGGPGIVWCRMEVTIDKHKPDPNDKNPRADLLDLAISYSDFGCSIQKPEEKTAFEGKLRETRFDRFAYAAVIDKNGELVSSDLAKQMTRLRNSVGDGQWTMNMLLEPAISCTWLCVFPKLGPFEHGEMVGRDIRDWTPLGVPDIEYSLGHGDTADTFHVVEGAGEKITLWSKTTRQLSSVEFPHPDFDNVSETTKIEITYSRELNAVEKASWERATNFEKQPQENASGSFEAILQKK